MSEVILVPIPGVGTLRLERSAFDAALVTDAGRDAGQSSEPLLDSEQLAAVLSVPASWLEQAAREKRIPSYEFGRWRRFKRSEVEAAVRGERA